MSDSVTSLAHTVRAFVASLENTETPADNGVVAKIGRVVARIAPERAGEVRIMVRGGSEDYTATSYRPQETIPIDESVVVVAYHPPRMVVVERLSEVLKAGERRNQQLPKA
jgi:hypothetical protein